MESRKVKTISVETSYALKSRGERKWWLIGNVESAGSSYKNKYVSTDGNGKREKEAGVTVREK